jgi:sugar fermentation stimulation protein A
MIEAGNTWVGVNTGRTNALVVEAIAQGRIKEFDAVDKIQQEVGTNRHTRLDLHIVQRGCSTFLEIKNCSLAIGGCAMFPDAVTARGTKHLRELTRLRGNGLRAGIFFLVQRLDAEYFAPATHIDPAYSNALAEAIVAGVKVFVYQAEVTPSGIDIIRPLPFIWTACTSLAKDAVPIRPDG